MSINSYKEDEQLEGTGKARTILRLLSYMRDFKKEITAVLLIMAFCVTVSLLNPLIIEAAIDRYISGKNLPGLFRLIGAAAVLNLLMIGGIKQHTPHHTRGTFLPYRVAGFAVF